MQVRQAWIRLLSRCRDQGESWSLVRQVDENLSLPTLRAVALVHQERKLGCLVSDGVVGRLDTMSENMETGLEMRSIESRNGDAVSTLNLLKLLGAVLSIRVLTRIVNTCTRLVERLDSIGTRTSRRGTEAFGPLTELRVDTSFTESNSPRTPATSVPLPTESTFGSGHANGDEVQVTIHDLLARGIEAESILRFSGYIDVIILDDTIFVAHHQRLIHSVRCEEKPGPARVLEAADVLEELKLLTPDVIGALREIGSRQIIEGMGG